MNPFKYIVIGAASAALIFVMMFNPFEPESVQQVKEACTNSNKVIDGGKEQSCAELQDKYNMEFLCDGVEASSHCWVETK